MSTDDLSTRTITRDELAELAGLFDRFEFALDPLAPEAKEAESQFMDRLRFLYAERVVPNFESIDFITFHCHVRSACRRYLRINPP